MKAYIVNIELVGSEPLIWRKVIMPADTTFNRLHDIIQTVTNFQGGYPSNGYQRKRMKSIRGTKKIKQCMMKSYAQHRKLF